MEAQTPLTNEQKAKLLGFASKDVANRGREQKEAEEERSKELAKKEEFLKSREVVVDSAPMERAASEEDRGSLVGRNPEEVVIGGKRTDYKPIG